MRKSFLKRIKPLIILFAIVLTVLIIPFLSIHILFGHASKWKYVVEDFEVYQQDFEAVAEFCLDYSEQKNVSALGRDLFVLNSDGNELLYNWQTVNITEDIRSSLQNIRGSFPHKNARFDSITCQDGMVYFKTHNGLYSVVYSTEQKPKYIDGIHKGSSKKIMNNWYHVVKKG